MRRLLMLLILAAAFSLTVAAPVHASDWDKAGKALTVIEGLRVFTGGNVDVIGSLTGINKNKRHGYSRYRKRRSPERYCSSRVWVPNYVWKRQYIPRHKEHHGRYGKIIVEGHYIKYKVERGGHWENSNYCG